MGRCLDLGVRTCGFRWIFSAWPEEKLAGQRLMAGFEGKDLDRDLQGLIADQRVGA